MRDLKLFSLAFFSYLLLTLYANIFLKHKLYAVNLDMSRIWIAALIALTFYLSFVFGYFKPIKLPKYIYWIIVFILSLAFVPYGPVTALFFIFAYFVYKERLFERFSYFAFFLGLAVVLFSYYYVGIPLLNWEVRFILSKILVLSSVLFTIGIVYVDNQKVKALLFIIAEILAFLGTFRSLMLLIFVAYFVPYYLKNKVDLRLIILLTLIGLALLYLSDNLTSLLVRIGFTFLVFHNLVNISLPFGFFHGSLLLNSDPRWRVAFMFTLNGSYTYFLFGQPIADFGILGILEAYLLGVLLRLSNRDLRGNVMVLSLLIYAIETGLDAFLLSSLILFGGIFSKGEVQS